MTKLVGVPIEHVTEWLRHFRVAAIWSLWGVAWALEVTGWIYDTRLIGFGIFIGLGAAVVVVWHVVEATSRRDRVNIEEMTTAIVLARQRRDGPRGVD